MSIYWLFLIISGAGIVIGTLYAAILAVATDGF